MKPAERVWLPQSHTNKKIVSLNRAVTTYDERLRFGRNEDTGDWCVFLLMPRDWDPPVVPIIGFGKEFPDEATVIQRIIGADMRRHGDRILDEINKHNESLKEPARAKADDASGEVAEAMESYMRNQEQTRYSKHYSREAESRRTGGK